MKTRLFIYLTIIVLSLVPGVRGEPHRPTLPATDAFQDAFAKNSAVYLSESPRRGPANAPVTIVVFSDFQ